MNDEQDPLNGWLADAFDRVFAGTPLSRLPAPRSPFGDVIEGVGPRVRSERTMNDETAEVDRRVADELRRRRVEQETARRLEMLDEYGADEFPGGAVVKFSKAYGARPGSRERVTYTYVALKIDGSWYLTGREHGGRRLTWDEFVGWLLGGADPVVRSRLVELVPAEQETRRKSTNER